MDDFNLLVLNWRDLKFNPLQPPPGVRPERWAEALVDVWAHAMGVFVPSKGYFLRKLRQLYHLYADEIEEGQYPSLFELRDLVRADAIHPSSPRFNYMERLENRTTMLTGFSGDIFDCARGHPIEDLLDRNVVLELQEPNQDVQQFVIEALLTWIFYYRDIAGHRQGLRHAVLVDEAKMIFDVQREQDTDIPHPPITNLMGRVQEFGEALIVPDHEPSKLSDSLKANTNAKLWMSLGSGHDLDEMAATFGIEDDKKEFTRTLERGEAVFATAESDPVPVVLPPYTVDKTTSQADIRKRSQAVLTSLSSHERVRPDSYQQLIGIGEQDDQISESEPETTDAPAEADEGTV